MSDEVPSSQSNPFEPAKRRKSQPLSIKYCAWEVLKGRPNGLVLSDLVKEIEDRELRHFSGKSSIQMVLREIRKQKEHFIHDEEKDLWRIKASQPVDSEETQDDESILPSSQKSKHKKASMSIKEKKISPLKTIKQEKIKDDEETKEELGKIGEGGAKEIIKSKPKMKAQSPPPHSSPSNKRKLERSPSPRSRKKAKGDALVGLPVKVWWAGEQKYFSGEISSYNKEKDRYDITYEDGDLDIDLELRKYDVEMKGAEIEWIRIDEHNMDDSDIEEGNNNEEDDGDNKKTEVIAVVEEKVEKQPLDEDEKELQA